MIGVDLEEIDRFIGKSEHFLSKIYTNSEIAYCLSYSKPESHLAVRFCAKEAVIKALSGFDIKNIYLKEIEIYLDENSVPQIRILKELKNKIIFQLSLSHSRNNAVAFVTAELET